MIAPGTATAFAAAAVFELAGCYAAWAVVRRGAHPGWLVAGIVALALFALLLTRIDTDASGRAYAAYGGIYIAVALVWLAVVDGVRPDRFDLIGAGLCLVGAAIIIAAPR
jgi:small multidrug resistance family-3 protein